MKFLKELTETPGVSGREEHVRQLIRRRTRGLWDDLTEDAIGNLYGTLAAAKRKRGVGEKSVVLACHLDQIGFYVRYIDDEGFVYLQHAGGFDARNLFARRVRIETAQGEISGILNPATKPVHIASAQERQRIPGLEEFAVDVGMTGPQAKAAIRPGDPVVIEQTTQEIGPLVCGQAMDNRVAPWVAINAIKRAKGKNVYDITWLGSAQEEVGIRGARVAAQRLASEVAIALDVTLAVDTPGGKRQEAVTRLGQGVAIKVMDSGSISTRSLVDEFVTLAEKKKIPFQYELLPLGGTDAAALQQFGPSRRTITLSIPCRYVHTVVETVHKDDLQAGVDLLAAWLKGG